MIIEWYLMCLTTFKRYCNYDTKQWFNDIFVNKQYVIGISVIKRNISFVNDDQMRKVIQISFKAI